MNATLLCNPNHRKMWKHTQLLECSSGPCCSAFGFGKGLVLQTMHVHFLEGRVMFLLQITGIKRKT